MNMHPDAAYWTRGVAHVPQTTGAATLLDGDDIRGICRMLNIKLPFFSVVDIGCGSGRMAQFVDRTYFGYDISPDCVSYCQGRGIDATHITDVDDIDLSTPVDWVTCLSLFTHMDRAERQRYLEVTTQLSKNLLADIIPGDGSGNVAMWTADEALWSWDLEHAGYTIIGTFEKNAPIGTHTHKYFRCEVL